MKYPLLRIDLGKIRENTEKMVQLCHQNGIQVAGVTKLVCGSPEVAAAMVAGGVDLLADSRLRNLMRLSDFPLPKMLLRIPMISQAKEIVAFSDIALVSEPKTVQILSEEAVQQRKPYRIILMIDLGDLREGIFHEEEAIAAAGYIRKMPLIELMGIGTNLTCYGGVKPSYAHLSRLVDLKERIESIHGISIPILSGGNGSTLSLLAGGEIPRQINQLRLGSSLTMGIGLNDEPIEGLHQDAFLLEAEITEVREKPSVPIGEIGLDAFGNRPVYTDRGMRIRAICAIGRQDIHPGHLTPTDHRIEVLGASSDHLILDVSDAVNRPAVGDVLQFHLSYGGCLSAMTSEYVAKEMSPDKKDHLVKREG